MLQFQLWKKLVVAVVVLGGVVYSLPNLVSDQMTSILPGEKNQSGTGFKRWVSFIVTGGCRCRAARTP